MLRVTLQSTYQSNKQNQLIITYMGTCGADRYEGRSIHVDLPVVDPPSPSALAGVSGFLGMIAAVSSSSSGKIKKPVEYDVSGYMWHR